MLSSECKYAIRASLFLAVHSTEEIKLGSKLIADQLKAPAPYMAKILKNMSKEGVITSTKGPGGGFYLSKRQLQGSILNIIVCIDGMEKFGKCFIGLSNCSDDFPCPVHHTVKKFKREFLDHTASKTIAELAQETDNGLTFLV